MKIRFIKDYLTYGKGFEFVNIDTLNGQRLIDLGVAEEVKTRKKKIKDTILTK